MADVEHRLAAGEVEFSVEQEPGTVLGCPKCGIVSASFDRRWRQWRHLDTWQYKWLLLADVPRIQCPEHCVLTVKVPWGEPASGFTTLFEVLVIDRLKEASIQAVSRQLKLSGTPLTVS